MEITIEVSDYLYHSLQRYAAVRKETIEELVIDLLEETYG